MPKQKPTKKVAESPAYQLAKILRSAIIEAWVRDNPYHTDPEFAGVKHTGQIGYVSVARELLNRGVRLPENS